MSRLSFIEKRKIPTYDDPDQVQPGVVTINADECSGCFLCIKLCPADSLEKKGNVAVFRKQGLNECMACGDCVAFCPESAIRLMRGNRCTGMYKTIDQGALTPPRL